MNRRALITSVWGIAILVLGIVGLFYNFGVLDAYALYGAYVVAGVLILGGLAFLLALAINTERWVLTIPGFTLLSLGVVVFLTTLEDIPPEWMGAIFLGGVALGFLVLFLSNRRERWWALLQACFIAVTALVGVGVGFLPVEQLGAVLFGGLGISFLLLYLAGGNRRAFAWTLVVAAILLIFAVALVANSAGADNVLVKLWPGLLVLLGVFVLVRVFTGRAPTVAPKQATAIPAEMLEESVMAPGTRSEPAQIVRPQGFSAPTNLPDSQTPIPVPPSEPDPEPVQNPSTSSIPSSEYEAPPDDLLTFDPDDPTAALDALLEASQKSQKGDG